MGLAWRVALLWGAVLAQATSDCGFPWVSKEHWQHCCCDRFERLTCGIHPAQWESCCHYDGAVCPPNSSVSREVYVHYLGCEGGEATFSVAGEKTTARRLLDCDHQPDWRNFRRLILGGGPLDALGAAGEELLARYNVSRDDAARVVTLHALQLQHMGLDTDGLARAPPMGEVFCVLGYATAAFVLAWLGLTREVLETALWLTSGGQPDPNGALDYSSSSSWPVGWWDIALNLGRQRPKRVMTVKEFVAFGGVPTPWSHPLDYHSALPQPAGGQPGVGRSAQARDVTAVLFVRHPGLDVEVPSMLLRALPHLRLVIVSSSPASHYLGGEAKVLDQVCAQAPLMCLPPHSRTGEVADEDDLLAQPFPLASLGLCSLPQHCKTLELWAGAELPMVIYYGGYPWNDWRVRAGWSTVEEHLEPLRDYWARGTDGSRGAPAVLLADAPVTAEIVHSYTGLLLPVYRPLGCYLTAAYAPDGHKGLLMLRSASMSSHAKTGWAMAALRAFAGWDFPVRIAAQDGFMSFQSIAAFQAILYWPGPHDWMSVQFREMYSMNMPILLPEKLQLMAHAGDLRKKLGYDFDAVPAAIWRPLPEHWQQRHPFSPWLPRNLRSSAYVQACLYWSQWLEYETWPHIQRFDSLPHLLEIVQSLDYAGISARMAQTNAAARETAERFWRERLPAAFMGWRQRGKTAEGRSE